MRTHLRLVTPPTDRAVTLDKARRHLRIEDQDSDDLVAMYLEAAEQSLAYVGRALKPATYALDVYGYPWRDFHIPMPPLRVVTSVTAAGDVVDPANYYVSTSSEGRGFVRMATAYDWPPYNPGRHL